METLLDFLNRYHDWLNLLVIPFTYGFVGWWTNWVALKMTFYPLSFWGIPPYLGWQGIIPRKAHKMAGKAVDVITARLLNVEEVFSRVDPARIEKELMPILRPAIKEATNEFAMSMNQTFWEMLPNVAKEEVYYKVERQSSDTIRDVIKGIKNDVNNMFDLKNLVIRNLTGKNVHLVVEMFQKVGGPEFSFVERSGFYFGLGLGLIQMVIWIIYPKEWTLPIQGVIVGYLTNWLALEMIFRPLKPTKYFGLFEYQGLFLKRQAAVSKEYSKIVAQKILNPKNILEEIFYGKAAPQVLGFIKNVLMHQIDSATTLAKPVIFTVGKYGEYEDIKSKMANKMAMIAVQSSPSLEKYLEETFDLENTMEDRMSKLPPEEYESILRTAFQEDEWLLILVGAVLGALVGWSQIYLL
jgi:uncharacterized membrane protein YheB (UPF0754 family)